MFKMMGFDTVDHEWHTLGNFSTEEAALRQAKKRVGHLKGNHTDDRHQVFIKRPDGSQYRVTE